MKKIKYLCITFLTFILFSTNVFAATNPYGKYQTLYGPKTVRCTWYAWQQAYDNAGVVLPGWGNAQTWYASARKAGYSVGLTPKANSIAVYSSSDGYGHVAYVTNVEGKNITINEGGALETVPYPCKDDPTQICSKTVAYNGDGIRNGFVYSSEGYDEDSLGSLIGYIYLDTAPKKTTNNNNANSVPKATTTKAKKQSSNNKLKSLTLDVKEINFEDNTYEYYIEVDYEVKIATIKAEVEDKKARVEGAGSKALNVGENIYTIKSIAENGDALEYKINITRDEKIEEVETVEEKKEAKIVKKKNENIYIFAGVIVAVLIILIIISCVIIKKHKKKRKNS